MGEGVLEKSRYGVSFLSLFPSTYSILELTSHTSNSAYMYRLCLEYTRILHHDEGDVDYVEMPTFDL